MGKGRTQKNKPEDKKSNDDAQVLTLERWYRHGKLYVSRKKGRRGLASTENCFDASIQAFDDNIKKSDV